MLSNPWVDCVHLFNKDDKIIIQNLKAQNFDFIIDLQKNIRSKRILSALKVPNFSFPKLNILKWILVNFKINWLPDLSIVDRYFQAVRKLKVENDHQGLSFFIPESARLKTEDLPLGHSAGFVACVIGGSFYTKRFPVEKWKVFCDLASYPIVLLGGKEDEGNGVEIAASNPGKIYNACGKFNLLESADIIRKAKVVVTNDTGLMHIAAAFQKPIVSLWGNTTPEMGMYPYYGQNNVKKNLSIISTILEVKELNCRPCSKIGFEECPMGHFNCMRNIEEEKIVNAVKELWNPKASNN